MQFSYRAYNRTGEVSDGEIAASDIGAAREKLWADGLTPFQVSPITGQKGAHRALTTRGKLSLPRLALFTRELATLVDADIPIDDALRIATEQSGDRQIRRVAEGLLQAVLSGAALSDAIETRDVFSSDLLNILRAGEISGSLSAALNETADLLERRLAVASKLTSAFIYPAILLLLALASVYVVISVLVPSIAPIFAESGRPIPDGLRIVMSIQAHWSEILGGGIGVVVSGLLAKLVASRNAAFRLTLHRFVLRLPMIGALVMKSQAARFSRTLGSLLRSGVPLVPAMDSAGAGASNASISDGVKVSLERVRNGSPLHRALEAIDFFPSMARRMIAVGEETGRLPAMLTRVAHILEGQVEQSISRAMSILTPALTVLISVLVGALILSVMTAVLSINEIAVR